LVESVYDPRELIVERRAMPSISRTLGQIHFEDLEPHRFEDLVAALVYDFRPWRKLESTGRLGSDEGYDVRGWEAVQNDASDDVDDEDADDLPPPMGDRLWLFQCKREKTIPPKKLAGYLAEIKPDKREPLYGLVFAAACDFSKRARDDFRDKCIELGVTEFTLWGKGDLETMLVQPKNDHLLFAFFGVSLRVRQRSLRTELRSRLATKRKLVKLCGKGPHVHKTVLLRDPEDDRYPFTRDSKGEKFKEPVRWLCRTVEGVTHEGIVVLFRDRFAYVADDGVKWDALIAGDRAVPYYHENPWEHEDELSVVHELQNRARAFWNGLPEQNRARYNVRCLVRYDDILAIDEDGDDCSPVPQIFVRFNSARKDPFAYGWGKLTLGDRVIPADMDNNIPYFPEELPPAPDDQVAVA
jgi:hypothetical protein